MSTYLDRVRHQVLLPGTDQYLTLSLTEKISPQFYIFTNIPSCLYADCEITSNQIICQYFTPMSFKLWYFLFCRAQFFGHFDGLDSGSIPPHIVGIVVSYPMQDCRIDKAVSLKCE